MKTLTAVTVAMALLTVPAAAQFSMGNDNSRTRSGMTEEEKRAEQEAEKAYKNTMRNTRSATPAVQKDDPWANVRPTTPTKQTR